MQYHMLRVGTSLVLIMYTFCSIFCNTYNLFSNNSLIKIILYDFIFSVLLLMTCVHQNEKENVRGVVWQSSQWLATII